MPTDNLFCSFFLLPLSLEGLLPIERIASFRCPIHNICFPSEFKVFTALPTYLRGRRMRSSENQTTWNSKGGFCLTRGWDSQGGAMPPPKWRQFDRAQLGACRMAIL